MPNPPPSPFSKGGRTILAAFIVASTFALLYALTATRAFSYDGICYSLDVEFAPLFNLFHPNHLLYSFVGRLVFDALQWVQPHVRALPILQGMNTLVAGAAVGVLFWVLAKDFGWRRALLGAAALGLCNAFWTEATDPGCYAWATLATCVVVAVFVHSEDMPAFWIGITHGAAILFHQMLVLAMPAFLWRLDRRRRSAYLGGVLLVAGGAYLAIDLIFHRGPLVSMLMWPVTTAGKPGEPFYWWQFNFVHDTASTWLGWVHTWIASGDKLHNRISALAQGVGLGAAVLLIQDASERSSSKTFARDTVSGLWIWILAMSLFQFFYLPGVLRFRLLFLPAVVYLILASNRFFKSGRWVGVLGAGVVGMGLLNYVAAVGPRSQIKNNPSLTRSVWVSRILRPGDVFLFSGSGADSIFNVYVLYFSPQVRGRSFAGYFYAHPHGDLTELQQMVEDARRQHRQIFLEAGLFDPVKQRALETAGQVPSGTLAKWLSAFKKGNALENPEGYRIVEVS